MQLLKNKFSAITKKVGGFLYSFICVIAVIFFFVAPISWLLIVGGIALLCVGTFGGIWFALKSQCAGQEASPITNELGSGLLGKKHLD
jgi:hypothetical protein